MAYMAPVSVGEEYEVEIEAVGAKGDGIAKVEGFVIFVPNTNKGDRVKIKVTRVLSKVGFGEVAGSTGEQQETPATDEEGAGESSEKPSEPQPEVEEEKPPEDSYDFGEEEKK